MPRYLVERTFSDGLEIPMTKDGAEDCSRIVRTNADEAVTWVHSYVNPERTQTFCIYDAPNPEAVRRAAERNCLPVDQMTEVRVLDPYFYSSDEGASRAAFPSASRNEPQHGDTP